MMFGHIDCQKCGHRHPETDDCQARKAERLDQAARMGVQVVRPIPEGWRFENLGTFGNGIVTPDQITVSQHMLKSLIEWGEKTAGHDSEGARFAANALPIIKAFDQFLALGFPPGASIHKV